MTSRGYIDFNSDYWCAFCGRKVHKGQEKHDKLGRQTGNVDTCFVMK